MKRENARFVLDLLKPENLGSRNLKIALPETATFSETWPGIFEYAARLHATLPAMVTLSRAPWFGELPTGVQLQIEERLRRERMMLAILDEELDSALFQLIGARIPVIVLKGMDLGRRYYPERILRPMTDVDLLVPPDEFQNALRALGRGGYRVSGPFPEGRFRVELSRRSGGPVVEMHHYMLQGDTDQSIAEIWERSEERAIPGLPLLARGLSAQDNLIYLIRHGAVQHQLESVVWMNDVHYLIESEEFKAKADWDKIIESLSQARSISGSWFFLKLLASEWGTSVPKEVLATLDGKVGLLRRALLGNLADLRSWFPSEGRKTSWVVRSRFLLRDNAIEALKYGIRRQRDRAREI